MKIQTSPSKSEEMQKIDEAQEENKGTRISPGKKKLLTSVCETLAQCTRHCPICSSHKARLPPRRTALSSPGTRRKPAQHASWSPSGGRRGDRRRRSLAFSRAPCSGLSPSDLSWLLPVILLFQAWQSPAQASVVGESAQSCCETPFSFRFARLP